jgi:hypothetical protein
MPNPTSAFSQVQCWWQKVLFYSHKPEYKVEADYERQEYHLSNVVDLSGIVKDVDNVLGLSMEEGFRVNVVS